MLVVWLLVDDECDAFDMDRPLIITNVQTEKSFRIEEKAVMGRQRGCHVVLSDTMAPRKHASILCRNGTYFIEDLGSRNGTFVNDRPVKKPTELRDGDTIRIGETCFAVGSGAGKTTRAPSLSDSDWSSADALTYETISPLKHDIAEAMSESSWAKKDKGLRQRLSVFAEISNAIRCLRRTADLEHEVVRRVRAAFSGAKRCLVVMRDEESEDLVVRSHDGDSTDEMAGVRISRTILENALSSGRAVMSANPLEDEA
jgi:predicted component of type VI protein secretion system